MSFPQHSLPEILIAAPSASTIERIGPLLREWRYPVQIAEDGKEVLRRLLSPAGPEIALIDASLTGLSGHELAAEVKRQKQGRPPWMMMLCEQADAGMAASAIDAGID